MTTPISGSGLTAQLAQLAKALEATPKAPAAAPEQPSFDAMKSSFESAGKQMMSLSGASATPATALPVNPDLAASIASLRGFGSSGVAPASLSAERMCSPDDPAALKKAISDGSDVRIRELVNGDPALLKGLSANEKGKALETLRGGVYCSADDEAAMVKIVKSCETKGELRAVLQAASGGIGQADMHKYDKELTDYHPCLIANLLNKNNPDLPETHPDSLQAQSYVTDKKDYPTSDMSERVSLAKGDVEDRRAFLESTTQVDAARATEPWHTDGCGAACIVASAMQNEDPQAAMSKLCDYNLKNMNSRDSVPKLEERTQKLTELKARIDAGEDISRADVDLLQETTYNTLCAKEATLPEANTSNKGIHPGAVKLVLEESGLGTSGGVIRSIDVDEAPEAYKDPASNGTKSSDHFVLVQKNGDIYDPWPRKDGNQIVPSETAEADKYESVMDPE